MHHVTYAGTSTGTGTGRSVTGDTVLHVLQYLFLPPTTTQCPFLLPITSIPHPPHHPPLRTSGPLSNLPAKDSLKSLHDWKGPVLKDLNIPVSAHSSLPTIQVRTSKTACFVEKVNGGHKDPVVADLVLVSVMVGKK